MHAYCREQQSPLVGGRLVEKIVAQIEILAGHPDMGRVVPEFELDHICGSWSEGRLSGLRLPSGQGQSLHRQDLAEQEVLGSALILPPLP